MSEANVLMTIPRTATEQVQVAINEYKGKKYLDLRVYYTTDEGKTWGPTKKGVTFPPEKLQELAEAIKIAQADLA